MPSDVEKSDNVPPFSTQTLPDTSLIKDQVPEEALQQQDPIGDNTHDPFIVTFEHTAAAHLNPKVLAPARKYLLTALISLTSFTRILISTLPAPALPAIRASLGMTSVQSVMSMSIYLLATALGPLLISPLSELYGRGVILHVTNVWFLVWNLTCGLAPSKELLIAARFLAGFAASAAYAVGMGFLGDIWTPEQRGKSLQYYSMIPLIGAAAGPILGGVIAEHVSWRWIFYSTSIFQGVLAAIFLLFFQETYAPTILSRVAARLRKVHGDARYTTPHEQLYSTSPSTPSGDGIKPTATKGKYILRALSQPLRLLLLHPIIQISGIASAVGYGTLYIILTSLAELFTNVYNNSTEVSGLHYLAAALGELVGAQLWGPVMDWFYARQKRRHQAYLSPSHGPDSVDEAEPQPEETRMPLVLWTSLAPGVGLILYGWSANFKIHWFAVDAGVFLAALGLQVNGMPRTGYLVDSYPNHVASAIAATQFLSSLTAFLFPLFTPALYRDLGYGWGNTLVAGILVVVGVPGAWILQRSGKKMRERAKALL